MKKIIILTGLVLFLLALYPASIWIKAWTRYRSTLPEIEERLHSAVASLDGKSKVSRSSDSPFITPSAFQSLWNDQSPSRILDRHGQVLAVIRKEGNAFVYRHQKVPTRISKAIVALEDNAFYEHPGFRISAILRATLINLKNRSAGQGGSTITQQLSKLLFTTRERKLSRKVFELFCALYIERNLSKEEILRLYINTVYLGQGQYGVANASRYYFQKDVDKLNWIEASHLASMLANPTYYSPLLYPDRSKVRHRTAVSALVNEELFSQKIAEVQFKRYWSEKPFSASGRAFSLWPVSELTYPFVLEWVRREWLKHNDEQLILQGGVDIHTGIDARFQSIIQSIVDRKSFLLSRQEAELAFIARDLKTGEIVAALGGRKFSRKNQLLRFEQIRRPIGSLAKPLVYSLAIEKKNWQWTNTVEDSPVSIPIPGRVWEPQNYNRKFDGAMPLSEALMRSRNVPAIKVLNDLGVQEYRKFLFSYLDLDSKRVPRNLSIALGSFDMSPLEVLGLYSGFSPTFEAPTSQIIASYSENGVLKDWSTPVLKVNRNNKSFMTNVHPVLREVVENPRGTGYRSAKAFPAGFLKRAGKTGTTQDKKDSWFAGYTPDYAVVVWVGRDDNKEMENAGGGKLAAPFFMEWLYQVYKNHPVREF